MRKAKIREAGIPGKGEIVLYRTPDGQTALDVRLEEETIWLSQAQMVELFEKDKRTISEHIRNVCELEGSSVVRKFRTTASDGKHYSVNYYNLDVIISIGYRVKSQRGTQFRIWATSVLRDHILKGYSANKRIAAALFFWFMEKRRHSIAGIHPSELQTTPLWPLLS